MIRLAAALPELNARLRGADPEKLDVNPTYMNVRGNGAPMAMAIDAGPLDFLNDVPGAADYDAMR